VEREVAEWGLIAEIGWSAERLFRRSRFAHMLWCVAGADDGQFSQIWLDVIRCMRSDVVISHTDLQ